MRLHWVLRLVVLSGVVAMTAEGQQVKVPTADLTQSQSSLVSMADARRLVSSGRFREAEETLRAYLLTDATSGQASYMLAYALLRQGKARESLEEYTRAAALQTPSAEELKDVGQAYVLLNDYTDAGTWMTRALEMDRRDPEIWYSLGRLRYSEQKYIEAADCFKQALSLAPGNVKAENNLGLAYEGMNRTDDAVAAYRQAIVWQDTGPADKISEQPLLNLAIVLLHRGENDEAQTLLTRAVSIAPKDARIHEQLGQLFLRRENYAEARKELEAATRLDPGQSNLHFLLGQAYRRLGMETEAKMEFAAAARLANSSEVSKPE